jgi:hypothetical protein
MEDARAAAKNDGRLLFHRAAEGKRGEEALLAIGDAYNDEMLTDPIRFPGQMHVCVRRDAGRFVGGTSASPCDAFEHPSRERHVRRAPDVSFGERPRVDRVPVPYQLK